MKKTLINYLLIADLLLIVLAFGYLLVSFMLPPLRQLPTELEPGVMEDVFMAAAISGAEYIMGFLLCVFSLWRFRRGGHWSGLLHLAMISYLSMTVQLGTSPLCAYYLGSFLPDLGIYAGYLLVSALIAFYSTRTVKDKPVLRILTVFLILSVLVSFWVKRFCPEMPEEEFTFLVDQLPEYLSFFALAATVILALLRWRRFSFFFRWFLPMFFGELGFVGLAVAATMAGNAPWAEHFLAEILNVSRLESMTFFLWPMLSLHLLATIVAAVAELFHFEMERRTNAELQKQRIELSMVSYENLQNYNTSVMNLRHDMSRHFSVLRQLLDESPERAAAYLDDLVDIDKSIHSVIRTGNKLLDVLLNGKLAPLQDRGVLVNVIRAEAPENLSLSDAEGSSLVLNILDNAAAAVSAPGAAGQWIRLDMHLKNNFWVFQCDNSVPEGYYDRPRDEKDRSVRHGLGMGIIRNITERANGHLTVDKQEDSFSVTAALPVLPASSGQQNG